jgi:hypothetical protein
VCKIPGVVKGSESIVEGKPGDCGEAIDEMVRIKSSLVDVVTC